MKHRLFCLAKGCLSVLGAWLALLSGIPIIGDILVLALGFYRTAPEWTVVLLLVGKFARFLIWNAVVGLF